MKDWSPIAGITLEAYPVLGKVGIGNFELRISNCGFEQESGFRKCEQLQPVASPRISQFAIRNSQFDFEITF